MPGQGKRKRRSEAERRRSAACTAPDAGRWEVIFETRDQAELRACLRRLREARVDESTIRIDTLCVRHMWQTTYRLSRFVVHPDRDPDPHRDRDPDPDPHRDPNPDPGATEVRS